MSGPRHIVVIGASTDGVAALKEIVHALPSSFPGAVFVVLHIGKHSELPAVLSRSAHLPTLWPFDGETIFPGRIYVAPPSHHMRIEPGRVRVAGDSVDHHKPSIDELFRSAAKAYGASTIGVVLTGYLDDGADGLRAIKEAGGTAVVQKNARIPDMPRAAAALAPVDYECPLEEIGPLLRRLVKA